MKNQKESLTITLSRLLHFLYFHSFFLFSPIFSRSLIFLIGKVVIEYSTETDLSHYDETFVLLYGLNLLSGISNFHFLRVFLFYQWNLIIFTKIRDNLKENSRLYLIGFHAKLFFSFFLSPFFVKTSIFQFFLKKTIIFIKKDYDSSLLP